MSTPRSSSAVVRILNNKRISDNQLAPSSLYVLRCTSRQLIATVTARAAVTHSSL